MDKHRQIAFISAFIVALVIMMIGKACTDKVMQKQGKSVTSSTSQSTPSYDYSNYSYNNNNNSYNNNTPQQTEPPQQYTESPVEYVTNMFGDIIGTAEPAVTDIPLDSALNADIQTTTKERSILEQYNENKANNTSAPDNSGYTPPSEINIIIH